MFVHDVYHQQEILRAAAALYATKPYETITMDAVAKKAGMAKGVLKRSGTSGNYSYSLNGRPLDAR